MFCRSCLIVQWICNVFNRYFINHRYFSSLKSIFSSRCCQRRRQQHHYLSTMWCVSKLDFMIISFRAMLKSNKLQRRCKFSFASCESCDQCLTNHNHYVTRVYWSLVSCDHNHVKINNLKRALMKQMYSLWRMLLIWVWRRSKRDNHKI